MRIRCELGIVGVLAGCGTYTTYQTAEPLASGRWQGSIAATPGLFYDVPSKVPTPTVITEIAARRGVGADTDVGLKLFSIGSELSVRHRVVNEQWQWAVLGAFAFARTEERGGFTEGVFGEMRLGVAATRRTSSRWAFTLGPTLTGSYWSFAGGGNARGLMAGAFANAEWTFCSCKRWHLVPELSFHATLTGDVPVDGVVTMLGVALARDF